MITVAAIKTSIEVVYSIYQIGSLIHKNVKSKKSRKRAKAQGWANIAFCLFSIIIVFIANMYIPDEAAWYIWALTFLGAILVSSLIYSIVYNIIYD